MAVVFSFEHRASFPQRDTCHLKQLRPERGRPIEKERPNAANRDKGDDGGDGDVGDERSGGDVALQCRSAPLIPSLLPQQIPPGKSHRSPQGRSLFIFLRCKPPQESIVESPVGWSR